MSSTPPSAAHPDLVLLNGRVTTMSTDARSAEVEAVAVSGERITAIGTSREIEDLAGPGTTVVDLAGRRVVPGLIDSHVHIVRAGRTWRDEVRWEDELTLESGLAAITRRSAERPAGSWIRVIGGWHPAQFPENRGPSRAELDAAAPDNPVYVQFLYDWAVLNTAAMRVLGVDHALVRELAEEGFDPASFETGADGELTGKVNGTPLMEWFYRRMPSPTFEEQVASTAEMSRELNRLGITGAIDGGGFNSGPDAYPAIRETWRRGLLTVRSRLAVHASRAGTEMDELAGYLRFTPLDVGDNMLRVIGSGEVALYRTVDKIAHPVVIDDEVRDQLRQMFTDLARNRWTVHTHAHHHETIDAVLTAWEQVHAEHDISDLRWSLVHAEPLRPADVDRIAALGAGVLAQGLFRFQGDEAITAWGAGTVAEAPPLRTLIERGIPLGLGSDAMRVASYNPFATLAWFLNGRTVTGNDTLDPRHLLTREEALRGYTASGTWFSFEENERGRLEPGLLADLAVLSDDYLTVDEEVIPRIESVLTLVGGRIVHTAKPFAELPVAHPVTQGVSRA
ncbi:amidohydrolase [Streptomyces uncialis]|uniref:amidohydrolase n=1 Tax=Streptomyces uncialis TaxID=1048205 RepID=UPI0038705604|nr:amidohydrolase [Streptomyces uncialis]